MAETKGKAKDGVRPGVATGPADLKPSNEAVSAAKRVYEAGYVSVQVLKSALQTHRDALIRLKDR